MKKKAAIFVGNFESWDDLEDSYINPGKFERDFGIKIIGGLEPETRFIDKVGTLIDVLAKFSKADQLLKATKMHHEKYKKINCAIVQFNVHDYPLLTEGKYNKLKQPTKKTRMSLVGVFELKA